MSLAVLTRREASIFAGVCDVVVSPQPPLPAIADTDAVAAFDRYLAGSPRLNRLGLRVLVLLAGLAPPVLRRAGPLRKALEGVVRLIYFGDDGVMRLLGYDPEANLRRARAAR